MVVHDGREDNRVFQETAAVGQALERLARAAGTEKGKQAAIVHDWSNKWALEDAQDPRNAGMGYWEEMTLHYSALAREGVTVDFINEDSSLDGYGLVVAPMLYLLREDFAEKLRTFTAAGGTLVVTYWSGVVDEHDHCWLGDAPHGLTETLGLRRAEIDSMYDGETRRCVAVEEGVPREAFGGTLCEVAVPMGAVPLMVYDEDFFKGAPAVTRYTCGKGRAYYLATRFEKDFYPVFYRGVCSGLFRMPWAEQAPEGVLITTRGGLIFLQNTNNAEAVIGGQRLPAFGTMVCELPENGKPALWSEIIRSGSLGIF